MAAELAYTVSSMVLLAAVTVGVARVDLGVPGSVCWYLLLPTVVVGSAAALWLRSTLGLDVFAIPAGVGVVIVALGAVTLARN